MQWTFANLILLSTVLHVAFLAYGAYQDTHPVVKFTDVDYLVFTDGARYVSQRLSPYLRATYRYTPLLAYLVLPNVAVHELWGKLLFCLCDIIAGWLIYGILTARGMSEHRASRYTAVWLLNPFVIAISTRGNAESVIVVLVLGTLWALIVKKARRPSAILFGVSVHFKIYPIVYALPLWLLLDQHYEDDTSMPRSTREPTATNVRKSTSARRNTGRLIRKFKQFFNWKRIEYGLISGGIFFALTGLMYCIYGNEFLQETYIYHITRKDHRHNFSPYFYHMYLSSSDFSTKSLIGRSLGAILSFLPQVGLLALLGTVLAKDIVFACFSQTFAFVMLNKVCTSQYFMWYLCFLPMILPSSKLVRRRWKFGVVLLLLWIGGQALWLSQAFRLEHLGHNTFRELWAAGAVFYLINAVVLAGLVLSHKYEPLFEGGTIRDVFGRGAEGKNNRIQNATAGRSTIETSQKRTARLSELGRTMTLSQRNLELHERSVGQGAREFIVTSTLPVWNAIDVALLTTSLCVLCGLYMCGRGDLSRRTVLYYIPLALLLTGTAVSKLLTVRSESVIFLHPLGMTLKTIYLFHARTRFIPLASIADIVINEAITLLTVKYYLAVVVKGEDSMVVVFERLTPRLAILQRVWSEGRQILFSSHQ